MKFPKDVELGKYYTVPHVFCKDFYDGVSNVWLPINTPLHDDKDYIKLSVRHYHIDWRFVDSAIYKRVCIDNLFPEFKTRAEQAYIVCEYACSKEKNIGDIVYKNVKCKRQYSNNVFHTDHPKLYKQWPVQLQSAYCGTTLKLNNDGQYVCPHKGAIIDLKYVDEFGYAVCPAHLLRFDTKTLKAINKLNTEQGVQASVATMLNSSNVSG